MVPSGKSLMTNSVISENGSDPPLRAAVVVAHPDDETLWCGGYMLSHPELHWRIVTLCRASDPDRAPKFSRVLERFGAEVYHRSSGYSRSMNSMPSAESAGL